MAARFPFGSYPRGWFVVAFSPDVAAGEVKTVHFFGQDIVLFRTATGTLSALDRTCPHLGAHLGAGRVDGECLRCPLHEWAFDRTGRCVEVPGVRRIPAKASVSAWPVREVDGVVMVWHCPLGAAPTWEPPALAEDGWTAGRTIRWEIRSHPQEVAERTVDGAHLGSIHHASSAEPPSAQQQDHRMRVVWRRVTADEVHDGELDVTLDGLGLVVSTTHATTAGLRTRRRIYPTPIDEERVVIFGVHDTAATSDPGSARELDERLYRAFVADFSRDFPIWETKAYLDQPVLVGGDETIGRFRAWARQFYEQGPVADAPADEGAVREQRGAQVRLGEWLRKVVH